MKDRFALSRRHVLAGSVGLGVLAAAGDAASAARARQAGVTDPPPAHALLLAYDLDDGQAARLLSRPPRRAGVTTTIAVGAGLATRLGLPSFDALPAFPRDRLQPRYCGGELLVQLCGDDPAVLGEMAARLGPAPRWRQAGFHSDRNLFGFRDGLANTLSGVWLTSGELEDGCFMVVRRISMDVAGFAALPAAAQEAAVGRRKADGAPLSGAEVDLFAISSDGHYLIPADAHVRLAHPAFDGGRRMLRRGYSYREDGDQGLLFIAFLPDPEVYVRVQRRLDAEDAMSRFVTAIGSALFLVLPGSWLR